MKTSTRSRPSSGPGKSARPSRGRGLIGKPVGRGYNSDPDDVVRTKAALERGGYYRRPRGEPLNPYPDKEMVEGIGRVQRLVGERPTGAMRPGDKTERVALAFLAGGSAATPEAGRGDDGAVSRFGARGSRRGVARRKGETGETLAAQIAIPVPLPPVVGVPPGTNPYDPAPGIAELLNDIWFAITGGRRARNMDHCYDEWQAEENRCREWRSEERVIELGINHDVVRRCCERAEVRYRVCLDNGRMPNDPREWIDDDIPELNRER
ncbi:MAG: hypothetical protein RLO50_00580 [Azospirillaceae bacterium]